MKRLVALVLAVIILFSLSACGEDTSPVGSITPGTDTGSKITLDLSSDQENNDEQEFNFGSAQGGTYENEFLGLGLKLDSNYKFLTEKEIAQLNGAVAETLDEELADSLKNAAVIYDMQAVHTTNATTISVNFESLGSNALTMDAQKYIDVALPQTEDAMKTINGISGLKVEKTFTTVAGNTERGIKISYTLSGVSINQIMACLKRGKYMALVSVATYDGSDPNTVLSQFYKL